MTSSYKASKNGQGISEKRGQLTDSQEKCAQIGKSVKANLKPARKNTGPTGKEGDANLRLTVYMDDLDAAVVEGDTRAMRKALKTMCGPSKQFQKSPTKPKGDKPADYYAMKASAYKALLARRFTNLPALKQACKTYGTVARPENLTGYCYLIGVKPILRPLLQSLFGLYPASAAFDSPLIAALARRKLLLPFTVDYVQNGLIHLTAAKSGLMLNYLPHIKGVNVGGRMKPLSAGSTKSYDSDDSGIVDDAAAETAESYVRSFNDPGSLTELVFFEKIPNVEEINRDAISEHIQMGGSVNWSLQLLSIPTTHQYYPSEDKGLNLCRLVLSGAPFVIVERVTTHCYLQWLNVAVTKAEYPTSATVDEMLQMPIFAQAMAKGDTVESLYVKAKGSNGHVSLQPFPGAKKMTFVTFIGLYLGKNIKFSGNTHSDELDRLCKTDYMRVVVDGLTDINAVVWQISAMEFVVMMVLLYYEKYREFAWVLGPALARLYCVTEHERIMNSAHEARRLARWAATRLTEREQQIVAVEPDSSSTSGTVTTDDSSLSEPEIQAIATRLAQRRTQRDSERRLQRRNHTAPTAIRLPNESQTNTASAAIQAAATAHEWGPTFLMAMASSDSWVTGLANGIAAVRPDWVGYCYRLALRVDLGKDPSVPAFISAACNNPNRITNQQLNVTLSGMSIHFSCEGGYISPHQLIEAFQSGRVPLQNGWVPLTPGMTIGRLRANQQARISNAIGALFYASVAVSTFATTLTLATVTNYVRHFGVVDTWRFFSWAWGKQAEDGHCYKHLQRLSLVPYPNLISTIALFDSNKLERHRVRATVHGDMVHIEPDPRGILPSAMVAVMKQGFVFTPSGLVRITSNMVIGGIPDRYTCYRIAVHVIAICSMWFVFPPISWPLFVPLLVTIMAFWPRLEPKIAFATVGSYGDFVTPAGAAEYLRSTGVDCFAENLTPNGSGVLLLEGAEHGEMILPAAILGAAQTRVVELMNDGVTVIVPVVSPLKGHGTFSVTNSPETVETYRYNIADPMLERLCDWIWRNLRPMIKFDCGPGGCPRYAPSGPNGELRPIRPRTNLGTGKVLVTLGSSCCDEPMGLDPDTTWSTNPKSAYKYEPRENHQEMFAEYSTIYCHGGAGTVEMARACGCDVISLSKDIDRDVKRTVVGRNYSLHESEIFPKIVPIVEDQALIKFVQHYPWESAPLMTTLRMVVAVSYRIMYRFLSITCMLTAAAIGLMSRIAAHGSFQGALTGLFEGDAIPPLVSMMMAGVAMELISWCYRSDEFWAFMTTHKFDIVKNTLLWADARYAGLSGAARIAFGEVFGAIAYFTFPMIWDSFMPKMRPLEILQRLQDLDIELTKNLSTKETIHIRFQIMESGWTNFLPLMIGHGELLNPVTGDSIGISCGDNSNCEIVRGNTNTGKLAKREWVLDTQVPIEDWPQAVAHIESYAGKAYYPLRHCLFGIYEWLNDQDVRCGNMAGIILVFGVVTYFASAVMFGAACVLLPLCAICGWNLVDITPAITFAGVGGLKNAKDVWQFVSGASRSVVDGPIVLSDPNKYPATRVSTEALFPTCLSVLKVNVAGKAVCYAPPMCGMNRPNYTKGRGAVYTYIHNINEEGVNSRVTKDQLALVDKLQWQVLQRKWQGKVAVLATTPERPLSQDVIDYVKTHMDQYIVLTNGPLTGHPSIALKATGRELATLRLAMPHIEGVTWVSMNAQYDKLASKALTKMRMTLPIIDKFDTPVSWTAHGLNPGAAGFLAYKRPVMTSSSIDFDIYGCEEWEMTKVPMTVFAADTLLLFNCVRREQDFDCKRRIVLYHADTTEDLCEFEITRWTVADILEGMASAQKKRHTIGIDQDGLTINGKSVMASPVISDMYPDGGNIEDIVEDIQSNPGTFVRKVQLYTNSMVKEAKQHPAWSLAVKSYYNVLLAFDRKNRGPKGVHAPIIGELEARRSEELKCDLHPNPVFVRADFESTLSHYVKHLNMYHKHGLLSPTEFKRRVNRNPHIDTWLQERLPDAFEQGIDASTIACRETMLASLARYNKGGLVDAMTDRDITGIVEAIYKQNKDMLSDAHIADPLKLTKKFLSYKRYSAGLPFTYEGSGISKRADLRRQGWMRPIAQLGLLPYKTGKWYPAIAHAFPKSQVVDKEKIENNPGKMRTIVATAGFNNVQQGILNYEINNRHDFMGSNEKVAMPLNGSHMNYIFSDVERFDHVYSLDATAMDANLSDGVLKVIAELRKKGFENHPAYEVIAKHIDCAMEQTKYSFVVNLVTDTVHDVPRGLLKKDLASWAAGIDFNDFTRHRSAPGGVLHKKCGGSTGDSNVTFNNTKGMPVIIMYSYCKAAGIDYDQFFDETGLHNFGDDDVLATDRGPSFMKKVVDIAKRDLGIILRFESNGTTVYDQTFLGRRPLPAADYADEFTSAGVEMPTYAIINDTSTMRMRLAKEKAEMTRHKGLRHELYRLEKAMGYTLLSAHQRDFYNVVVDYFNEVVGRIPPEISNATWFRKKYKIIPYDEVIRKWYKPISPDAFGVHALQFEVGLLAKTEKALLRTMNMFGWLADSFPSHLVTPDGQVNAYRTTELYTGIFEAHAWHTHVKDFGEAPTLAQLEQRVAASPYHQFTNCDFWYRTVGRTLPTKGELFERNANHAMWRLLIYTTIYVNVNKVALILDKVPMGNVLIELSNLCLFKARKLFGTMSYMHYVARGKSSPRIDALAPKDPYAFHKRAAAIIVNALPQFKLLGYLDTSWVANRTSEIVSIAAETATLNTSADTNLENQPVRTPWRKAYNEAMDWLNVGKIPVLVSHTGTGKTRNVPPLALYDPARRWTNVVVVMPRNLICYEWCKTSGATFKKRGVSGIKPLNCCTYGYLAHCLANNNVWWNESTLFIFDEAHEESVEWIYVRRCWLESMSAICMTATPEARTCQNFQLVHVDIAPQFDIMETTAKDLEEAITIHCPTANRFLIIEPSLRRCNKISERLTATGYPNKVVHSGDREIPDGLHIVATSVIEAAITIPGCDLVIDTGSRLVTDGGTGLIRVPNTVPGYIQRRGRTGRTNNGKYVTLMAPENKEYEPLPDINLVLMDHPIVKPLKVKKQMDKAPDVNSVPGDNYMHVPKNTPNEERHSIGLIHKLLQGHDISTSEHLYKQFKRGCPPDDMAHLQDGLFEPHLLLDWKAAIKAYVQAGPVYKEGGRVIGHKMFFKNYKLVADFNQLQKEGIVQESQLDTGNATPDFLRAKNGRKRQVIKRARMGGGKNSRHLNNRKPNTSA